MTGRVGRWELWCGVWFWWAVAALAVSICLPAASYLMLLPLLFTTAAALGVIRTRHAYGSSMALVGVGISAALAAVLWMKAALGLADAVGSAHVALVAVPLMLSALVFLPLGLPTRRSSCARAT